MTLVDYCDDWDEKELTAVETPGPIL